MVPNVVLNLVLNSISYILDNDCFPSLPPMQKLINKANGINIDFDKTSTVCESCKNGNTFCSEKICSRNILPRPFKTGR